MKNKSRVEFLLHDSRFLKGRAIVGRSCSCFNILAILAILYYRVSFVFHCKTNDYNNREPAVAMLPWVVMFAAELVGSFLWFIKQPMQWQPICRSVFPESLPKDEELLPGVDVFICTADPKKEPTLEVMNTVISAMSLDYPGHKLHVYVSDDGGAPVTLYAMKEAWVFATWWLPFCKRFNIVPICPQAFFQDLQPHLSAGHTTTTTTTNTKEFHDHSHLIKEKYEIFKQRVRHLKESTEIDSHADTSTAQDHPAIIQVINEKVLQDNGVSINPEKINMPFLMYVAREKRPSRPNHFKAGALNVLQRVSSVFSNSGYILVLDCDMYCNDSVSARQAMCYYLDSKMSSSLAWVQFPQRFHNISDTDIYDSQMRLLWPVLYLGMDGLQGPLLSGTNFYINRKALYGFPIDKDDNDDDLKELRYTFGSSNKLIRSLSRNDKPNAVMKTREISSEYLKEAQHLATCAYEENTQWGTKIGFRYDTVVEDVMTGFMLHGQGWKSVYLNPRRPQFFGSATTNLNEVLIQHTRWKAGLLQLGLSKYCPLFYNSPRLLILQRMVYIWASLLPLEFFPMLCFAIVPPICFFYGIPLYPKVSDPFFVPYAFVFISSRLKHLWEDFLAGGSVNAWLNEQRLAMIQGVTCYAYATLECVMAALGLRQTSFIPTNKAEDDDTSKWYRIGKFDFRTSNMFLVPIVGAVTLNVFSFVGGVATMVIVDHQSLDTMFAQLFLSFYVLIITFPVIEGMLLRTDNARIPVSTILISTLLCWMLLTSGHFILLG